MGNISGIIENVKDNIKYFINSDDTFEVVIEKIVKKLADNEVYIKNKGYEILDFKDNYSKVAFKIKVHHREEEKEIQLLRKYVAPAVLKKLPSDFKDRYRRYCGEAYNKVHEFLKKHSSVQVIKNYQRMEKQLLKASLVK